MVLIHAEAGVYTANSFEKACVAMSGEQFPQVSNSSHQQILVGGLEHVSLFHRLGLIIPTDSYFFLLKMVKTTNQDMFHHCLMNMLFS